MIKPTIVPYYLSSLVDVCMYTSWWRIPQLLWKKPVLFSLPLGLQFQVWNLMDIWTLKELILDCHYEKEYPIPHRATVIDVGGSIGDFSVFAQKVRCAQVVHSFEPAPNRTMLYRQNQDLNGCSNAVLHPIAIQSLDELFQRTKISHCDFMKVDCEGAEYSIFSHASKKNLKKITHIAFEVHFFTEEMKQQYKKLCSTLSDNGFRLVEKSNPVHTEIGFLYATQK